MTDTQIPRLAVPVTADPIWAARPDSGSVVEIHAVGGPDSGRIWSLGPGVHDIGSAPGSTVELTGPGLPERSVRLTVTIAGSAGLELPEDPHHRAPYLAEVTPPEGWTAGVGALNWPAGTDFALGAHLLRLVRPGGDTEPATGPRRRQFWLPTLPAFPRRNPVPTALVPVPLLVGALLSTLTRQSMFLLIALLSPALAELAWYFAGKVGTRAFWAGLRGYWQRRIAVTREVAEAVSAERAARNHRALDPARLGLVTTTGRLAWRRRTDPGHLVLRVGTGTQPSSIEVRDPARSGDQLVRWSLPDVPHTLDLRDTGTLGVTGDITTVRALAGWLVVQLAALHDPRDVRVCVVGEPDRWHWVDRLPHAAPAEGWFGLPGADELGALSDRLADPLAGLARRTGTLAALIRARARSGVRSDQPAIVLVVDGVHRIREAPGLSQILAEGPEVGVYLILLDESERLLPPECAAVIRCAPDELTLSQHDLPKITGIRPDLVGPDWCERVADALADREDDPAGEFVAEIRIAEPGPAAVHPVQRLVAPAHRSSRAERLACATRLGPVHPRYLDAVQELVALSTSPAGLTEPAALQDLAALYAYLRNRLSTVDSGLRSGRAEPDRAVVACLVSALHRLPTHHGACYARADARRLPAQAYQVGQTLIEPAFVRTDTTWPAGPRGSVRYAIWSYSGKRMRFLDPGSDTVVFAAGTEFVVIDVDNGPAPVVFLAERLAGSSPTPGAREQRIQEHLRKQAAAIGNADAPAGLGFTLGLDDTGRPFQLAEDPGAVPVW